MNKILKNFYFLCVFVTVVETTVVLPQHYGSPSTITASYMTLCSKIHQQFFLSRTYISYLKLDNN